MQKKHALHKKRADIFYLVVLQEKVIILSQSCNCKKNNWNGQLSTIFKHADAFNVVGLGEHVEGLTRNQPIATIYDDFQVTRQSLGIARDIDYAWNRHCQQFVHQSKSTSAGWIKQQQVKFLFTSQQ